MSLTSLLQCSATVLLVSALTNFGAANAAMARESAASPLFADDATLSLTLAFPMSELRKGEDLEEPLAGRVIYREAGRDVALDVEVDTRGHSRLLLCDMPPLKLNFDRDQLDGTVFAGQNKLKLVTHCKASKKFYRYLEQEYAIYRVYNSLTDASFRVRKLNITYRDTGGRRKERSFGAFLIESDRELAARLGMREVEVRAVTHGELDPDNLTTFGLFQYLIGNTDWAVLKGRGDDLCCHNGLLLEQGEGGYLVVPYDFDQAGLINSDYALPAEGLGIRSVRTRVFRGFCTGDDRLAAATERFLARREVIESAFPTQGDFRRSNTRALRYIDEFYATLENPEKRRSDIEDECRGRESFWNATQSAAARGGHDAPPFDLGSAPGSPLRTQSPAATASAAASSSSRDAAALPRGLANRAMPR